MLYIFFRRGRGASEYKISPFKSCIDNWQIGPLIFTSRICKVACKVAYHREILIGIIVRGQKVKSSPTIINTASLSA